MAVSDGSMVRFYNLLDAKIPVKVAKSFDILAAEAVFYVQLV
jgi:hypothetical protein